MSFVIDNLNKDLSNSWYFLKTSMSFSTVLLSSDQVV
jgi:hypothetical protein